MSKMIRQASEAGGPCIATPQELRQHVAYLPARGRISERFAGNGGPRHRGTAWYVTQQEHLLGWLREYSGAGAYARQVSERSAEFVYNHFQCAPGLLWLAEAAGAPRARVSAAATAAMKAGRNNAAQCAAVRRVLPWPLVEKCLLSFMARERAR